MCRDIFSCVGGCPAHRERPEEGEKCGHQGGPAAQLQARRRTLDCRRAPQGSHGRRVSEAEL